MNPEIENVINERMNPSTMEIVTDWRATRLAATGFSSPIFLATRNMHPALAAVISPSTSHIVDMFRPTPAVAAAPIEPTMAVSISDESETKNCSAIEGMERDIIAFTGLFPKVFMFCSDIANSSFLHMTTC